MDFIGEWSEKTEVSAKSFIRWIGVNRSKFYDWKSRYGKANEHNGKIPRDHWIEEWEKQAIIEFHSKFPLEGYRRLSFMMNDENIVFVSPSTTYRVLKKAGVLDRLEPQKVTKRQGFLAA